ncbi:MAG: hypothetical protein KDK65_05970, partial [Chlamydiia bacterium]|nr:hypothetical protein [Chlamydiia bacterium]
DELLQAQLFAIRYAKLTGREIEMGRKALHEAYLDVEKRNRILQVEFKGELERGRGDIAEALGELKQGATRNFWKAGKLAKDDPQRSEFKQLAKEHQQSYRALKEQRDTFAALLELENVYQNFLALPKPLPVVEEVLRVEVENRVTPKALTPADRALIKQIEAVIGTTQLQGAENNLALAYGRFAAFAEAKRSVFRDLLIYGEGDVYKAIAALCEKRDNAFFSAMSFSNEEEQKQLGRKWSVLVDAVKELEAAAPELAAIEKIEKAYRPEPTKRETTPKTDVSDAMIDLLDQYKQRPQSPLPRELTATDRLIQSALTAKPAPLAGKPPELKLKAAPWKPTQVTVTV